MIIYLLAVEVLKTAVKNLLICRYFTPIAEKISTKMVVHCEFHCEFYLTRIKYLVENLPNRTYQ